MIIKNTKIYLNNNKRKIWLTTPSRLFSFEFIYPEIEMGCLVKI